MFASPPVVSEARAKRGVSLQGHKIKVEKVQSSDCGLCTDVCWRGEACPPEDAGGPHSSILTSWIFLFEILKQHKIGVAPKTLMLRIRRLLHG